MKKQGNVKENTLKRMLDFLHKIGVNDYTIEMTTDLNRMSLRTIAQGKNLKIAHEFYFRTLLKLLEEKRHDEGSGMQDLIKNFMFSVMIDEFGI